MGITLKLFNYELALNLGFKKFRTSLKRFSCKMNLSLTFNKKLKQHP